MYRLIFRYYAETAIEESTIPVRRHVDMAEIVMYTVRRIYLKTQLKTELFSFIVSPNNNRRVAGKTGHFTSRFYD